MVGSRTAVTLGQRAQAGAKMLFEFLGERPDQRVQIRENYGTRFLFLNPDRIFEPPHQNH